MTETIEPDRPLPAPTAEGARTRWRMRRRYYVFATGVAALGMADLVFAVAPGWSTLLFFAGLLLVGIGWLAVAVLGWRYTGAVTVAVVVGYLALPTTTPALRSVSWRMFVWSERESMDRAVELLRPAQMKEGFPWRAPRCESLPGLPPADCAPLLAAMENFGATYAWKKKGMTVFVTHRWINIRGGVLHCPRDAEPCEAPGLRHVTGEWYRWWQV